MQKYLSKCHYHTDKEPYCPNFRLGYIATQARENFSELCRTVSFAHQSLLLEFETFLIWKSHFISINIRVPVWDFFVCLGCFLQGGVIGVFINWDCNLDIDPSNCKPTYSFRRLDLRKDQANSGYYFRQVITRRSQVFASLPQRCSDAVMLFGLFRTGLPNITTEMEWSLEPLSRLTAFVWTSSYMET